jgi:hypothetical protein
MSIRTEFASDWSIKDAVSAWCRLLATNRSVQGATSYAPPHLEPVLAFVRGLSSISGLAE